jgi:hypothetical protein
MLDRKKLLTALATPLTVMAVMAVLLFAGSAQALPYFNGPSGFGFDNSTLSLPGDYVINPTAPGYVESGVTDPLLTNLGLLAVDVSTETFGQPIDRTVTFTFINNAPGTLTDLLFVFTGLGANGADYATANIDLDISGFDPMEISSLTTTDTFWLAGYRLTSADFDANQMATRTFRYTVDVPEVNGAPPDLGIMYMTDFTVPEPATGLLLSASLLMAVGAGRRRTL